MKLDEYIELWKRLQIIEYTTEAEKIKNKRRRVNMNKR